MAVAKIKKNKCTEKKGARQLGSKRVWPELENIDLVSSETPGAAFEKEYERRKYAGCMKRGIHITVCSSERNSTNPDKCLQAEGTMQPLP